MTSLEKSGLSGDVQSVRAEDGAVWSRGALVRIEQGSLAGTSGTVVDNRADGRLLLRIQPGLYVEMRPETLRPGGE